MARGVPSLHGGGVDPSGEGAAERMRDQMQMQEVQDFEARLSARRESERRGGVEDPALVAFAWWIEELRVSLFAQQLGTKFPVSAKRLEKRWAELTGRSA